MEGRGAVRQRVLYAIQHTVRPVFARPRVPAVVRKCPPELREDGEVRAATRGGNVAGGVVEAVAAKKKTVQRVAKQSAARKQQANTSITSDCHRHVWWWGCCVEGLKGMWGMQKIMHGRKRSCW